MGRIKKHFMDKLLAMPEAQALIQRDRDSFRSRCLSNALRNRGKPESEHIPTPSISAETFKELSLIYGLRKDLALKESQSLKGRIPKKNVSIEHVHALLDEWADRQLKEGVNPDSRGWKEYLFRRLNVSGWRVVKRKLDQLGVSEEDLIQRLKRHEPC